MNKVILIGNIGKEPICAERYATFSVATNERVKNGETYQNKTTWHNVVVFGEQKINLIRNYVHSGTKIMIEGKLNYSEYEKDGAKQYKTEIIALEIELLGTIGNQQQQEKKEADKTEEEQVAVIFPPKANKKEKQPTTMSMEQIKVIADANNANVTTQPQPQPQPQPQQQKQEQEQEKEKEQNANINNNDLNLELPF